MEASNNWNQQLKNRKIKPSDEAWLAIEAGLEGKLKDKIKMNYIMTLAAACIAGIIIYISIPSTKDIVVSKNSISKNTVLPEESVFPDALFIKSAPSTLSKKNKITNENLATTNYKSSVTTKTEAKKPSTNNQLSTEITKKASSLLSEVEADLALKENEIGKDHQTEVDILLAEAKLLIEKKEYNSLYNYAVSENLLAEVEKDLSKNKLQDRVWQFVKDNVQNLESAIVSLR